MVRQAHQERLNLMIVTLQRPETQRWSVERGMTTQERCHDEDNHPKVRGNFIFWVAWGWLGIAQFRRVVLLATKITILFRVGCSRL